MDIPAAVTSPTNAEVGEKIGLTHSAVSRIRSGDRLPSLAAMRAIEKAYGWTRYHQLLARDQHAYAAAFEQIINRPTNTSNLTPPEKTAS
jgi:transcriptional regulator with XRE-family HTH domain